MTRRKLRSCSKCGVRHGPPIGNRCKRSEEEFQRLSEEMGETPETGIRDDAIPDEKGDEEDKLEAAGTTNQNTVKGMDYDSPREVDLTMEDDLASFTEFRRRKERERRGIIENDSAGSTSRFLCPPLTSIYILKYLNNSHFLLSIFLVNQFATLIVR